MRLNFVDRLPKQGTGARKTKMRTEVLAELVEVLAGEAGTWAIYPWQLVRPDLAEEGVRNVVKRVDSHVRQVQQMAKEGIEPFHEYGVELAIRQGVPYIRVEPLTGYRARNL